MEAHGCGGELMLFKLCFPINKVNLPNLYTSMNLSWAFFAIVYQKGLFFWRFIDINRVQFNTAILMYKSVNGQSPMYLTNMFQFCSDQHSHLTRSITSLNLVPPPIKIQLFKHSFTYQGIVIWNSLSLNMKMAPSLSTFKRLYLEERFLTLWPEAWQV